MFNYVKEHTDNNLSLINKLSSGEKLTIEERLQIINIISGIKNKIEPPPITYTGGHIYINDNTKGVSPLGEDKGTSEVI